MEADTWKRRVWVRVGTANQLCINVPVILTSLQAKIGSPVPSARSDAAAGRAWIEATQDQLEGASNHLASAMAVMGAIREVALHGAGLSPAEPLASIDDLGSEDLPERNALTKLRDARDLAVSAYDHVQWCCSHLWAASVLLNHPLLPGVDGLIETERLAAVDRLVQAKNQAHQIAALTTGAVADVSGAAAGGAN